MSNTAFFARNGLSVNNFFTVNSTAASVGGGIVLTNSVLAIGNGAVNVVANGSLLSFANSTASLNVSLFGFQTGSFLANQTQITLSGFVANATTISLGSNVFI